MTKARMVLLVALAAFAASGGTALAHPHIFAEARLEVVLSEEGTVESLRHVWLFDEYFSSTVMLEFDANTNLKFETAELEAVGRTVKQSLADFDYYTSISQNGEAVDVAPPEQIYADFKDGRLLLFFEHAPAEEMKLEGKLSFGVYDPTMYAAIDFVHDSDLVVMGEMGDCEKTVVRPDPDEVLAQNQASLTEAFFNDPEGNDLSKLFATRLELIC